MATIRTISRWTWHRLHDIHTALFSGGLVKAAWERKGHPLMLLTCVAAATSGLVLAIRAAPVWVIALVCLTCLIVPAVLIVTYLGHEGKANKPTAPSGTAATTKPEDTPLSPAPTANEGRLAFGDIMNSRIGPGVGNEATMIAIRNTVMEFKYICRNIKAKLTFTHLHSGETLIVGAWFTVFENDKPRKPVDSVSLFSNERAWVVICVRDIGGELYPFSGPGNAPNLLPEWTIKNLGDERQRLTFGKWQVKIVITSDSGDELYREEGIQAIE